MNAYEIADKLNFDAITMNWKSFADAGTMIRQQADRIAKLEKEVKDALEIGIAEGFIKAHKQSAEPVGRFMSDAAGNWGCVWFDDKKPKNGELLYTTPQTKPLSDKEIIQIWGVKSIWDDKLIKFARAIEKRHGIK